MDSEKKYFIGDMSRMCKLSKKALRYYDDIHLIPSHRHGQNNYRYYTDKSLLTVPVIKYYKQMGFTLEEMKVFIEGDDPNVFKIIKDSFLKKIRSFEIEQEKLYRKHTAVKDWYDLLEEAETVIENDISSVSIKFIENSEFLYQNQMYYQDTESAIINVNFTNYVEEIDNEITGPVIINYSSHQDRQQNEKQKIKILQKVIRPCRKELKEHIGGAAGISCYHIGSHKNISQTYKKIYRWASDNNYILSKESFERYVVDYWTTRDSSMFVTEIFIMAKRS